MAINLDFDTQQKLLRAAGLMNTSVQALSNLLLSEACKALDSEAITKLLRDSTITATGVVVNGAIETKKMNHKRRY